MKKSLKSTPPRSRPIGGIRTSLTSEVTILPNAAPMITPTARSTTLPRMMNVLNSLSMGLSPVRAARARGAPSWPTRSAHTLQRAPGGARGAGETRPRGRLDERRVSAHALGGASLEAGRLRGLRLLHRSDPVNDLLGNEPDRKSEHDHVRDQVRQCHRPPSSDAITKQAACHQQSRGITAFWRPLARGPG